MEPLLFGVFTERDLQNIDTAFLLADRAGITDINVFRQQLQDYLRKQRQAIRPTVPVATRTRVVSIKCSICGGPAIKVPVNTDAGNQIDGGYTHAILCRKVPVVGQPWRDHHCGHTDYVIEVGYGV